MVGEVLEKPERCLPPMAGEVAQGTTEPILSVRLAHVQEEEPVKKKSSFQITSVRSARHGDESFSSDMGGAEFVEEDEDEGDEEGEGEGEEEDESTEGTITPLVDASTNGSAGGTYPFLPMQTGGENSTSAGTASGHDRSLPSTGSTSSQSNGSVGASHSSHSKFRVVRIQAKHVNKRYAMGRWSCWDYSDTIDSGQHSEDDRSIRAPNITSASHVDDSSSSSTSSAAKRKEVKFLVQSVGETDLLLPAASANGPSDETSATVRDANETGVSFRPIGASNATTSDQPHSRHAIAGGEDAEHDSVADGRRLDTVLRSVTDLLRQYTCDEHREAASLKQHNGKLVARISELEHRESHLQHELERLRADHQRLADENSHLVHLLTSTSPQRQPKT